MVALARRWMDAVRQFLSEAGCRNYVVAGVLAGAELLASAAFLVVAGFADAGFLTAGDFLAGDFLVVAGWAAAFVAGLAGGVATALVTVVAASLALLQRFFCAAAILLRAAALRTRRLAGAGIWARADASAVEVALGGRPGLRLMLRREMLPRIAFASCRRAIS